MRAMVNPHKDAAYFKRTASVTKKVNLPKKVYRGGIRF